MKEVSVSFIFRNFHHYAMARGASQHLLLMSTVVSVGVNNTGRHSLYKLSRIPAKLKHRLLIVWVLYMAFRAIIE